MRLGEPEAQAAPLGGAEGLTAPSRDQQSPSIQESAVMSSMQLLSGDEAELVEEGGQDDWTTKAWTSLTRFLMLGSCLLGATKAMAKTKELAALPQEQDQVEGQLEVRLGELEAQATPLGGAEELTVPS